MRIQAPMTGTAQKRLAYGLSIVAAATPFGFALIRAARTGDVRYFWVALASVAGAAFALNTTKTRAKLTAVASTFVVATAFAVSAAVLMGTTLGVPILVVGFAFGSCFAAGAFFLMRAHP